MAITKAMRPAASRLAFPGHAFPFPMLEERFRQLFDEPLSVFASDPFAQVIGWLPATDVTEDENELVLTAELPGMARKDVNVSVEGGVLSIKGEKSEERKEEDKKRDYRVVEREYGAFQRAFTLPPNIDATRITATMKDGILAIRLPKTTEAKSNGRTIEISG